MFNEYEIILKRIEDSNLSITLADPSKSDCPLVFVNENFEKLTFYNKRNLIGKTALFMQGSGTDEGDIADISSALRQHQEWSGMLLNYKADGSIFNNLLFIDPISLVDGTVFMIGCHFEVRSANDTKAKSGEFLFQKPETRRLVSQSRKAVIDSYQVRKKTLLTNLQMDLNRRRRKLNEQ